jgi:putative phage-type endonuclease
MTAPAVGRSPTVLPIRQRTPEWLAARLELGIGASEAAAVIGESDYESPIGLWARKLGLVPPPLETLPMRMGTALEPLISQLYTEATGVRIRRANNLRQHPVHGFMLASLDRRAGRKPVELKFSGRGKGYGEPGTDEVPDEVLAQVLHQLAVTDEPEADVAALIAGRHAVQIYTVRREQAAEDAIIEHEAVFWDHVQTRTEPPVDGSEATRQALAAIYPRDEGETLEADKRLRRYLLDLRDAQRRLDQAEADKLVARNRITARMGKRYAKLVAPGVGEVTWKTTKDRETVAWEAVAADLRSSYDLALSLYAKGEPIDVDGVTAWLDAVIPSNTKTKPGDRRFGPPKFDEEEPA